MLCTKMLRTHFKSIASIGTVVLLCVFVYFYSGGLSKPVKVIPVNRDNLFVQRTSNTFHPPLPIQPLSPRQSSTPAENNNVGPQPPDHQADKEDDGDKGSLDLKDMKDNDGEKVDLNAKDEQPNEQKNDIAPLEVAVLDVGDDDTDSSLYDDTMVGRLNYDVWKWIVGYYVDDMRIDAAFPNHPDEKKESNTLHIVFDEADPQDVLGKYGHKIYGYLIPPTKGDYHFGIEMSKSTAACSAELWVSTDADPLNIHKVVVLEYDDMQRPNPRKAFDDRKESGIVRLDSRVHYFEFLEKAFEGHADIEVKWKKPNEDQFVTIEAKHFAMAIKLDEEKQYVEGSVLEILKGPLPSNQQQTHHHIHFVGDVIYKITNLDVLPTCDFKAEYVRPRRIKAYTGIYQVHESKVYPKDETWFKNWHKPDKGNPVIAKETADKVLSLYTKAFNSHETYKGEVKRLRYLEETTNKEKGSRFLLELDIQLTEPREELVHTSEYVYLPAGTDGLCHTSNFQWLNKDEPVDVHLVVSLKNLGWWVRHLIQNMEKIYEQTKDEHFQLVIVDYESEDMDVEEELKKSSLKRWHVVHKKGAFSRSGGLQAGVDYVTDPESIVMTIDMHLTLPTGFVEYVRRHVVKGKMGFTPFFFRLNKGYTEINYNGFWETMTYGLFGLYKSEWSSFGGFNTKKYTNKWGGEDWDLLDKAVSKGYEAFRIRYPGLVHYHHTRAGMWGSKNKNDKAKKGNS